MGVGHRAGRRSGRERESKGQVVSQVMAAGGPHREPRDEINEGNKRRAGGRQARRERRKRACTREQGGPAGCRAGGACCEN